MAVTINRHAIVTVIVIEKLPYPSDFPSDVMVMTLVTVICKHILGVRCWHDPPDLS